MKDHLSNINDNFAKDSGLWIDTADDATISFTGGGKRFEKTAVGWQNGGMVSTFSRQLQPGDTFKFKFNPVTFATGKTPVSVDGTFWQIGLILDQQALPDPQMSPFGYGLYLEANAYRAANANVIITAGEQSVTSAGNTRNVSLVVSGDSKLHVYVSDHPNPSQADLISAITGPFIGRFAWVYFNIYSEDTVDLLSFSADFVD